MGMDSVAEGNANAGERRQQVTLACTTVVNTHETRHCILPMSLLADPCQSYQSRK